jgi:flavin-binding protein dodecin
MCLGWTLFQPELSEQSLTQTQGVEMTNHVYSVSEIVGSSPDTIEDAINNALARAHKTLRNLDWFEVTEVRGRLAADGAVEHYQVSLKLGFRMED